MCRGGDGAFAVACIVVVEGVCRSRPCDGCPCFGLFRDIDLRRTGGAWHLRTFGVVSRYAEFAYAHGHIHCDKPVEHRCQPVAGVWPRMEDSRGGRRHAGCPMARLFHRFVAASSLQASTSAVAPGSEG